MECLACGPGGGRGWQFHAGSSAPWSPDRWFKDKVQRKSHSISRSFRQDDGWGGHRCGRAGGRRCQLQGCPRRAVQLDQAGLPTSVPGAQPPPSFGVPATAARRPGTMCQTGKQEMCSSRKPQFWKIKTKIFFSKIIIEKSTLQ